MKIVNVGALLCPLALAQQPGTQKDNGHPSITTETCTAAGCTSQSKMVTMDGNWMWCVSHARSLSLPNWSCNVAPPLLRSTVDAHPAAADDSSETHLRRGAQPFRERSRTAITFDALSTSPR